MEQGIIDFEAIKQIMGNDKETLVSFFELFKEQTKIEIEDLGKSIEENNLAKISAIAHKLKSSYGSIGSTSAYTTLAELEKSAKENSGSEKIKELLNKFLEIQGNILEEMDKFISL
jgi:HPt (histidine-containing phosphotransfer) domain-containing protein